jgi:hypothetical protein
MSPLKAKDIPVHLRGYYIPPHLRPAGQKATPGKPILPYIEPHQRLGILPVVIPNDAEYQSPKVPPNSPASILEKSNTPDTKSSTSTSAKKAAYLASTWEEFMGGKTDISATKQAGAQLGSPLGSATNAIRRTIQLPPDCLSTKLAVDRGVPKVQEKENMVNGVSWPVQEAHNSSPGKQSQVSVGEQIEKAKQPELLEPKIHSTAEMPAVDTSVRQTPLEYVSDVKEVIMFEVQNPQPAILDLTREALIQETGAAPKESAGSGLDAFVSDDGIESPATADGPKMADSRGYLAELDTTLQQHDGTWMPVPIDWVQERTSFNGAFIPEYITTWSRTVPAPGGKVDTDRDEFKTGLSPISLLKFEEPVGQPLSYPGK